jgi:hypothetical protein
MAANDAVFDFSRVPLIGEDAVVRTTFVFAGEEFWVEEIVTSQGRRALFDWSDNWTAEEALQSLRDIAA